MDNNANVIAVTFPESSSAYEAPSNLKELDGQGQVVVQGRPLSSAPRTVS
jgi:hypothetical protein